MSFRVLTAYGDDAAEWDRLIDILPADARDPHLTSAYARVQEELCAEALLATYEDHGGLIVKPIMMRPINPKRPGAEGFDLTSPYQYGGMAGSLDPEIDDCFYGQFELWARAQRVVCEYCVTSALISPIPFPEYPSIAEKPVVVVDLTRDWKKTLRPDKHQAIRKAQELGVQVRLKAGTDTNIRRFSELYASVMEAKGAAARWRFPDAYFRAYFEEMPTRAGLWFATAGADEDLTAAAVTVAGGSTVYYHFAATTRTVRGASDLLIWCICKEAELAGYKRVHLGGGVGARAEDPLLHFKAGFSPPQTSARSYFRVFDQDRYMALSSEQKARERKVFGREVDTPFVPIYRRTPA